MMISLWREIRLSFGFGLGFAQGCGIGIIFQILRTLIFSHRVQEALVEGVAFSIASGFDFLREVRWAFGADLDRGRCLSKWASLNMIARLSRSRLTALLLILLEGCLVENIFGIDRERDIDIDGFGGIDTARSAMHL